MIGFARREGPSVAIAVASEWATVAGPIMNRVGARLPQGPYRRPAVCKRSRLLGDEERDADSKSGPASEGGSCDFTRHRRRWRAVGRLRHQLQRTHGHGAALSRRVVQGRLWRHGCAGLAPPSRLCDFQPQSSHRSGPDEADPPTRGSLHERVDGHRRRHEPTFPRHAGNASGAQSGSSSPTHQVHGWWRGRHERSSPPSGRRTR